MPRREEHRVAYPPLDTPKQVAEALWIVDSGPHSALGLKLPVRMTVIRLSGGDLFLHSPTRCTPALLDALGRLGRIRHLVAPSVGHWSYVVQWQRACPDALCWAVPVLGRRPTVRRSELRIDRALDDESPAEWSDEIAQRIIPGAGGYQEAAFFHRPSRSLILTDLIQQLEPGKLHPVARLLLRAAGSTAPHGRAPAYLRAAIWPKRRTAAARLSSLFARDPERVLFAHGRPSCSAEEARRSLRWLLG